MADPRMLLITHILAAGAGYILAPREILESEVSHTGFFEVDTKRVLAAAVESLRAENKLLVYTYKGFAAVSVNRDGPLFLDGQQDLIVPAVVSYFVNLSELTPANVTYNPALNIIKVQLPPLVMGDVVFEPEGARTINGGLLTYSQAEVDDLNRLAFAQARRAFIKQAQSVTLVKAARRQATINVENALELPLRAVGRPDLKVVASFPPG